MRGRSPPGDPHALRLRPRHRAPPHQQQQVAQVSRRRPAALGGGHGLPLARAGGAGAAGARRARGVRLRLRGAGVRRGLRRPRAEALRLDDRAGGPGADPGRDPRPQRGLSRAHRARRRPADAAPGLPADPPVADQPRAHPRRGPARARAGRPLRGRSRRLSRRDPPAHARVHPLQPPQPGRPRLHARRARRDGADLPRARHPDHRRRDPLRPALLRASVTSRSPRSRPRSSGAPSP